MSENVFVVGLEVLVGCYDFEFEKSFSFGRLWLIVLLCLYSKGWW